jgi:hypothetical protein
MNGIALAVRTVNVVLKHLGKLPRGPRVSELREGLCLLADRRSQKGAPSSFESGLGQRGWLARI